MESNKAIIALRNLSSLLIELNYHSEPANFMEELGDNDPFINLHLRNVLLQRTKAKALLKKKKFEELKIQFDELKKIGLEKLQALIKPADNMEMVKLFNRFEELTADDIDTIKDDQDFLSFISNLKDNLEDQNDSD